MRLKEFALYSLCGVSAIILSGCAFASGLTQEEKAMVADLQPSQFQPATREVRDNIDTQDNFAQAAFWSREYQLNPSDLEAAIKLSAAVRRMGNPGKAVEIAQTSRAMHPTDPYLTAEYAAALIASNRADEAIEALDGGLRRAPGYARLWSLKGAALDQTENYDLAQRHYNRALQITPHDPNIMANIGLSYALAGDPARAEGWLKKAASMPGAGAGIRQNLSLVMQLQGKDPASVPQASVQQASAQHAPVQQTYAQRRPLRAAPTYRQPARQPQAYSPRPQTRPQPNAYSGAQAARQQAYGNAQAKPSQANHQTARASAPQTPQSGFGHRSNFTVVGQQSGAPKTAADAARAAARAGKSRKVIVPAGQPVPTGSGADILNQIARNVGPQRAASSAAATSKNNYPSAPYAGGYGPYTQQAQATQQPSSTAKRRGAARRR